MKKYLIFPIIVGLLSSTSFLSFSEELKIGYVDILKVFNEYQKTKDYDKNLEQKKEEAEKNLDPKREAIKKMQSRLDVLKEEERQKEVEKIKKEAQEYQELERKTFIDIKKERDEKMKEIIEDIDKIIDEYAKKNGFNLIINENAVLYGDKVMDVTLDILKIANTKYRKK